MESQTQVTSAPAIQGSPRTLTSDETEQLKANLEGRLKEIANDLANLGKIDLAAIRECCGNDSIDRANAMQEIEKISAEVRDKERRQRKLKSNLDRITSGVFTTSCLGCQGSIEFSDLMKNLAARFCSKPRCKKQESYN